MPEYPLRAVIMAGSLILAMIVSAFFIKGWDQASLSYIRVFYLALIACGAYLVTKQDLMPRISAAIIAVVSPLLYYFIYTLRNIFTATQTVSIGRAFENMQLMPIITELAFSICIIAVALVISLVLNNRTKHNPVILALCCGATAVFVSLISAVVSGFYPNALVIILVRGVAYIPIALALGLAIMLVFMLCTMKSHTLETRTGHKVWFALCFTFTTISFVITFLGGVIGSSVFSYSGFVLALLTILGIVGYLQLLTSKRLGYLLILLAIGTMFFGEVIMNFSSIMSVLAGGYGQVGILLSNLAASLPTLINPTITGIVLYFIWKKIPEAKPFNKRKLSLFSIISSSTALVMGTALFFTGAAKFFDPYSFIRSTATLPSVSFVLGVFFGAVVAVLGAYGVLAYFRKESKAPKALFILGLVAAVIALLFLLAILIG